MASNPSAAYSENGPPCADSLDPNNVELILALMTSVGLVSVLLCTAAIVLVLVLRLYRSAGCIAVRNRLRSANLFQGGGEARQHSALPGYSLLYALPAMGKVDVYHMGHSTSVLLRHVLQESEAMGGSIRVQLHIIRPRRDIRDTIHHRVVRTGWSLVRDTELERQLPPEHQQGRGH